MFKNMKLGTKLLIAFILVGLIPLAVVSIISSNKSSSSLSQLAYGGLEGMREVKKAQIEKFFNERRGDMGVLMETVSALRDEAFNRLNAVQESRKKHIEDYINSIINGVNILKDDPYVRQALIEFEEAFVQGGERVDTPEWRSVVDKYDARMKDVMSDNGWYDIFLIHHDGDIVYTVGRESDLGMVIPESALKNSGLGKAFRSARSAGNDDIVIADFEPYAPSNGAQAAFMMAKMHHASGELAGYVAIQVPTDTINTIMQQRQGLGTTGESYLVGRHDGKTSFRSDMKTMGDGKYVIGYPIETPYINSALDNHKGADVYTDSKGNLVMVAYEPLEIDGINWACVSKINVEEAIVPKGNGDEKDYFAKYIEKYGYYDLFLIHPEGKVFYTVSKEADFGTNMVDGKYADSGLGQLVRRVLDQKQFALADFSPYAPSNNEPASFIAQPVIQNGKVELIVALQLSLDAINSIMQQRDGMGKTGETYLVGSDKLMRSDSYLDPQNHSVKASFANPRKGSVDTEASREALSGKKGEKVINDYNGNPVLSAYTPVKVGRETAWALIAEVDEAEAFAAVKAIKWVIGIIALLSIAAIITVALLITRSITKPINRIIADLNDGSEQVSSASTQVSSASQSLAEGASEQAASIEETSSSLEEMSAMTKTNADNANQANNLMMSANQVVGDANTAMHDLTISMNEISSASEETSKIVKTIDEIAFQTNLLALNAAVEAARAGEAGAGFSVVAEEVRNLAMRAAEAAKKTANLIETTVKKVGDGSALVNKTNDAFNQVADSAAKVGELVNEISAASNEQAEGIEQVNKAVSQMDQVTQQNAANAEESASASEELNAQAEQMKAMVEELVTIIRGANGKKGSDGKSTLMLHSTSQNSHGGGKPKQAKTMRSKNVDPEETIQLNDGEFKDF